MKQKILFMCACAFMALIACSCSKNEDLQDKKVALILPSGEVVSRWNNDAKYITDALSSYGYQVKLFTTEETTLGATKQVNQINEALNSGYTHFIITPIDSKAINESGILQRHQECDFICFDRMIMDNDAVDFYVTCDPEKIGAMQGRFLMQYFHSSGCESMTIEYFAGPESDRNSLSFFNSAFSLLSKETGFRVPSGKSSYKACSLPSWSSNDAKAEMLGRLEETNEIPDLILAPNDNVADGIINALIERGCNAQFPVITGQDMTGTAVNHIRAGRQTMTIYKEDEEMARNAAMVMNCIILGTPINSGKTFSNGAKDVPVIYSSATLVIKDDIGQLY